MAKIFFEINIDGELTSWSTSRGSDNEIELEVEDTHPIFFGNPFFFKFKDGILAESEELKTKIKDRRSQVREIFDLKQVLAETDFYFIRQLDEKTPVPADIQVKRQEARRRLRELGL